MEQNKTAVAQQPQTSNGVAKHTTSVAAPKQSAIELLKQEMPTLVALAAINLGDKEHAQAVILQELEYLRELAITTPAILQCAPQSVIFAVKRAIKNNMTLDPQAGLIYVKTRMVNIAPKGQPENKVQIMETQETVNGIVSKNRMLGRILDIKRPTVTLDANGKCTGVKLEYLVPSTPSPRWAEIEFSEYDFEKWQAYSKKENSRWDASKDANPLYTSWKGGIDPEFARAKAIRHGLKKIGANPNERIAKAIQPTDLLIPLSVAVSEANDAEPTHTVTVVEAVNLTGEDKAAYGNNEVKQATNNELPL